MKFVKSSFSGAGNCVEAAVTEDVEIVVRNSRFPDVELPAFTPEEWRAFIDGVVAGEFGTAKLIAEMSESDGV